MILSKKGKDKGADQTADAQAGLRLCCSRTPEGRFSRIILIFVQKAGDFAAISKYSIAYNDANKLFITTIFG